MLCGCGCGQPTRVATKTNRRDGQVRGQPLRYIHGHNPDGRPRGPRCPESPPNPEGICWCGCGKTTPLATHPGPGQLRGEHLRYCRGHAGGEMRRERARHEAELRHLRGGRYESPLPPLIKAYLRAFDELLRAHSLESWKAARARMTERLAAFWPAPR